MCSSECNMENWALMQSSGLNTVKFRCIQTTQFLSMRADNNRNEEEYQHTIRHLIILFYLNKWLKPSISKDTDYKHALQSLKSFSVKAEHTIQANGTI